MRLVVVGGVAAGTKAASRARRVDPGMEIVVYQEEPDVSMSECGLPYLISGVVGERDDLIARTPEEFAEKDIEMKVRHCVRRIDPENKTLVVQDLTTGENFKDSYDRLIICTGARVVAPPIEGVDLDGVFTLRFLTDTDGIMRYVREHSPKTAVVVGGGYIGVEVAENLKESGMEVALIEAQDRCVSDYGPEVAEKVETTLKENGVAVHTGAEVREILDDGKGHARAVRFGEGEEVEAGLVIVAVGIEPVVELAEEAGAKLGETGAIRVDKHLRTSLQDVWAAGDCAETTNLATGEAIWVPLGDTANQMGRVAGTNAVRDGDRDGENNQLLEFPGVLGTGVFKVFDLAVAKTGLSEEDAEEAGFEVVTASMDSVAKAGYYPGSAPVFLKLIADEATGRLLGAEIAGSKADKYVDVCATAIWGGLSYPDLVNLDLAYAPPYGPVLSPIIQAATILSGKFERQAEGVRASE